MDGDWNLRIENDEEAMNEATSNEDEQTTSRVLRMLLLVLSSLEQ